MTLMQSATEMHEELVHEHSAHNYHPLPVVVAEGIGGREGQGLLLELLTRRNYKILPLEELRSSRRDGQEIVTARFPLEGRRLGLFATIADGSELVRVVGRVVIDDGDLRPPAERAAAFGPALEVPGELAVGDDVDVVDLLDGREVVEHVFEHRLAGHVEQRLRLVQRQRVEPRGIPGGEYD